MPFLIGKLITAITRCCLKDLGSNYYNQFNKERKANSMVKKLKTLGYDVTIATAAVTA